MIAFLCALVNLSLIIYCLASQKSIFHPVCLVNAMWLAVNMLNVILGWNSAEAVYLILALPSLFFSIGFFLVEKDLVDRYIFKRFKIFSAAAALFRRTCEKCKVFLAKCLSAPAKSRIGKRLVQHLQSSRVDGFYTLQGMYRIVFDALFIYVVVVFAFMAYDFISRLGLYNHGNLWYTLRVIIWDHHVPDWFIYKYSTTVVLLLPSVLLVAAQKSKKRSDLIKFFISLIIAVAWTFLLTSRTATFQAIIILVMSQILLMENPDTPLDAKVLASIRKKKLLLFAGAVGFILLIFTYVALKKNGDLYGDVSIFEFFLKSIANYTNLSSAAFVEWFKGGFEYSYGASTFRFVIAVLNRLGLSSIVPVANEGGIFITFEGLPTNALTVARAYIEDFGVVYMAFILMVFGMIHGAVYKRACRYTGLKRIRFALINAMLDVPLFFQILTNLYLNTLSGWIQFAFWSWVFTASVFWIKTETNPCKSVE